MFYVATFYLVGTAIFSCVCRISVSVVTYTKDKFLIDSCGLYCIEEGDSSTR